MMMETWKFTLIWLLPGFVLIGICLQQGEWRKTPWKFAVWIPLLLCFGPFFLGGLAYYRSRH